MLHFNKETCISCGLCAKHCYPSHLKMSISGPILPENKCLNCGHCAAICPTGSLTIFGDGYSADDVLETSTYQPVDAQQLLHLIKCKRSIRHYKTTPVPHTILEQVLEAGKYSPTIGNLQTLQYIILEHEKMYYVQLAAEALLRGKQTNHPVLSMYRMELIESIYHESHANGNDKLFHNAPAVILIIDKQQPETCTNTYIAAARIELMAESLGLGTCYCGAFLRAIEINRQIIQELHIPKDYQIYAALTIGYPSEQYIRSVARLPVNVEWK